MSNVYNKADMVLIVADSKGLDENGELKSDDSILGMSGYVDGKFKAESVVEADKEYKKGDLVCAFITFNEETESNEIISKWVDVPGFKTNPIPITDITTKGNLEETLEANKDSYLDVDLIGTEDSKYGTVQKGIDNTKTIKISAESSDPTIVEIMETSIRRGSTNLVYNVSYRTLKAGEATISIKHEYLDKTITREITVTE
ncbi:hypothetical protein HOR18_gp155 [Staphylococcus phage vB_SscM-1]|uniref:Uncharacterized protein n=3 Tax=Viruses TaxID=10239 RepID=A0A1X9I9X0_9CAUD|nr:hypothetical protein HOR18_gp155 [Staphylococcus phage vB_SscM-1]ANT44818.1 hypothetical protein vB_SscM-1_154 [Staphylococcus phage vB_SscM-1]ANT45020.1 hypothetical protein vB_SscM-2_153 [Staphylococcus phage vB_SscM-2]